MVPLSPARLEGSRSSVRMIAEPQASLASSSELLAGAGAARGSGGCSNRLVVRGLLKQEAARGNGQHHVEGRAPGTGSSKLRRWDSWEQGAG